MLLAFAATLLFSFQNVCADSTSTAELRELLGQQAAFLRNHRIYFEVEEYFDREAQVPPQSGPTPAQFVHKKSCSFIASGDWYRYEETTLETSTALSGLVGRRVVRTFDGVEARTARFYPKRTHTQHEGGIYSAPQRSLVSEQFLTWYGWWVFQLPERVGYLDLVNSDEIEGPFEAEDGRTYWRVTVPNVPLCGVRIYIHRTLGKIELDEIEFRGFKTRLWAEDEDVEVRTRIEFSRGANADLPLAPDAKITISHLREEPEDEFWGYTRIHLVSVEPILKDDNIFRAAFANDARVEDTRYRCTYRLGTNELNVDGRLLTTHKPLSGGVGDRLEWWTSRGEWEPLYHPIANDANNTDLGDHSGEKVLMYQPWFTALALALVALIILWRGRRVTK